MTHLSLFSGIGGIDLAAHWAGFETVAFVEKDPFCQKVLAKNFPGVPIYDDVSTFNGKQFAGVDLISGGFPCQDISSANKRATGLDGARSGLWFQMLRIIDEAKPRWVVAENVRQLINMGIDVCLDGLENIGYETGAIVVPAAGVGAWHKRDRVFIVGANLDSCGEPNLPVDAETQADRRVAGRDRSGSHDHGMGSVSLDGEAKPARAVCDDQIGNGEAQEQREGNDLVRGVSPYDQGAICERGSEEPVQGPRRQIGAGLVPDFGERSRLFEPKLCGDIRGIPNGVDRLRSLGNCVVPQQVYPILKAIAEAV